MFQRGSDGLLNLFLRNGIDDGTIIGFGSSRGKKNMAGLVPKSSATFFLDFSIADRVSRPKL